jgi:hypothetical protein
MKFCSFLIFSAYDSLKNKIPEEVLLAVGVDKKSALDSYVQN